MPCFKLTVAYEGTGFVGWQRQAQGPSIQGSLEDALAALEGRPVTVTAAGRTDAGVHALAQVVSVQLERSVDEKTVVRAANARLPAAIRVLDARAMAPGFHAQFSVTRKTYRYRIWNDEILSPFERRHAWHVPAPVLDVSAMATVARVFEGWHDFSTFQAAGSDVQTAEREVLSSRVVREERALVIFEITGKGFLRHMVRSIAGTLVEVGRGRRTPASVSEDLASRDRARAGPTAPAEGLFLVSVEYE